MAQTNTRNVHLPLPTPLYDRLRMESRRAGRPVTEIVREAVDQWLSELHRRQIHDAIRAYAESAAGTTDDLDRDLEATAVEHLLAGNPDGGPRP